MVMVKPEVRYCIIIVGRDVTAFGSCILHCVDPEASATYLCCIVCLITGPYLDIVRDCKERVNVPIAIYQVVLLSMLFSLRVHRGISSAHPQVPFDF